MIKNLIKKFSCKEIIILLLLLFSVSTFYLLSENSNSSCS